MKFAYQDFSLCSLGITIEQVFQTNNNILFTLNELSLIWIHSMIVTIMQIANFILKLRKLRFEIKDVLSDVVLG